MKKLPIGIQTFTKIIEDNYAYVDKTYFAHKLISSGQYYFLSRPRRFGKSLFLDTLAEIFRGNKELFKGLYIYDKHSFKPHPVIRITFGSGDYIEENLVLNEIRNNFRRNIRDLKIESPLTDDYRTSFQELIFNTHAQYNERVVILIDEYDKPILDNITNKGYALRARHILKNFYSVIKDNDNLVRFVFITGVSKFSKMNLFSGLNNLEDITVDANFGEICGYTHQDLKKVFAEHLKDANLDLVKRWYNGYYYFGERVYNPFDILLFISKGLEYRNYWWNTGNPSFLIKKLEEGNYSIPQIEEAVISEESLDAFDVEYIDLLALLWQTGYLTFENRITDEFGAVSYRLTLPNLEIQFSLNQFFIDYLTNQRHEKITHKHNMQKALRECDFDLFVSILKTIFATIPYQNYANNIISQYEGYYASVIFVYLSALGYPVIPEDTTNRGRIDMTLKTNDNVVIIEFKVDTQQDPIQQIKEKRYYEKYMEQAARIYLLGINFDSHEKNITDYKIEEMKGRKPSIIS
ncbi:MAG: ATP-binding protein [Deltaproteobacteria bacterium]|nr:ATP-binding protein [Deltaproteobacteria bacterium]